MLDRWLSSFPDLDLLELDVKPGRQQRRDSAKLFPFSLPLLSHSERALARCLSFLAAGDAVNAAAVAVAEHRSGTMLPDLDLLAGCFFMAEGRIEAALEPLEKAYRYSIDDSGGRPTPGLATRRMYPGLRLLTRVCPVLLLPLYPNEYACGLIYALALYHSEQYAAALETLREVAKEHGINDELKLVGGMAHLGRGDFNAAAAALAAPEQSQRDSVELARCVYLAYAQARQGNYRPAIRELSSALMLVKDANPQLYARASVLLAHCYAQMHLPLQALRSSGRVMPEEVPGYVAEEMLQGESEWLGALQALDPGELERMARADDYTLAIPEDDPIAVNTKFDVHKNPIADLKATEISWVRRREEERQIEQYKDAVARGLPVPMISERVLSGEAQELKARIKRAEQWWPTRREMLLNAAPRARLANSHAGAVGHVRFDFCGERPAPNYWLAGERRAQLIGAIAGAALLIAIVMAVLRSVVYH